MLFFVKENKLTGQHRPNADKPDDKEKHAMYKRHSSASIQEAKQSNLPGYYQPGASSKVSSCILIFCKRWHDDHEVNKMFAHTIESSNNLCEKHSCE